MNRPIGLVVTLLGALTAAVVAAPVSSAATLTVSPGDRIHSPDSSCTLAYTYRSITDAHTYAVTAGHCGTRHAVTDAVSGATGTFVRAVEDPPGRGGADFGLIDFGTTTSPGDVIGEHRLVYGIDRTAPGETVCRSGATTGEHCGVVQSRRGAMQYLTAPQMVPGAGGDSGGPVWVRRGAHVEIIGVWLGGITPAGGPDLGRFGGLADAFEVLGLT
ncbi:MAG: hypothetical protein QG597_492 [Actinomycetota bacterium]|nr:hypothetical protein [Actinomycetota bacterium]